MVVFRRPIKAMNPRKGAETQGDNHRRQAVAHAIKAMNPRKGAETLVGIIPPDFLDWLLAELSKP
jgi:hypothetical protein